jgi:hypothetical protein
VSLERLRRRHPNLQPERCTIESPASKRYNCFAWAMGDDRYWWEPFNPLWDLMDMPGRHWPTDDLAPLTVEKLARAFATRGYTACESGDHVEGVEKIAMYAYEPAGEPTHAALQLETGVWASKMGRAEDIHHRDARDLEDDQYGRVVLYMQRPRAVASGA